MKSILPVVLLTVATFAQTLVGVLPDDAAAHLVASPQPKYPALAEQARIQGNVILDIQIEPSGAVSSINLISGHPMLAPAAIEAVRGWKYRPFEVAGKPATVRTWVMVTFGNPLHDARTELAFEYNFWALMVAADAAVTKGDFPLADEKLAKVGDIISADTTRILHLDERWRWMTAMGRLRMLEQKNEEAEKFYKDALALRETNKQEEPNSFQIGTSLANLAALYRQEKKLDLAQTDAGRALAIFSKRFKSVGQNDEGRRQLYGRAAAEESLLLLKVAKDRNDSADADKQCRTLTEFQSFLSTEGQSTLHSECAASK
jgi:TonB family protein